MSKTASTDWIPYWADTENRRMARIEGAFEDKVAALSGCWGGVYIDLDTSELFQVDGADMVIWKGWVIADSDDKLDS